MKEMLSRGIILCTLLTVCLFGKAENLEETVLKKVSYAISEQTYVELSNQYGEIQIVTWEKDSFKLEASITASTDKGSEDLNRLLNMVEVLARGSETSVVVSTDWTSGNTIWKRGKMDLKNLLSSDKKLEVNYKVYLPAKCRLTIENRFGDVYLPDYAGPLRVTLSHGDLRARNIEDARSISVRYGKMIVKKVQTGLIKVDFGSMILDKAENLTLQSKSSNIEIIEVARLGIRSKGDDLRIDLVESLRGESSFSHIRLKEVSKLVDLNTSYGDVTIRGVKEEFELIRMIGTGTDYDVDFAREVAYRFTLFVSGNKGTSFSPSITVTTQDELKDDTMYKGYSVDEQANALIDIEAKNGYVHLFGP